MASADPVWVDRRLTLVKNEMGVDVGVGMADDLKDHVVGPGMYAQFHYGLTDRIELSVREGLNFGLYGRYARAEQYARLYSLSGSVTPGPGAFANPDLVLIGRFLDFGFLELAGEFEFTPPVEDGTHMSATAGVAAVFHGGDFVRFDTGAYATGTLRSPSTETYVFPMELWFEPTSRIPFWFGPLAEWKRVSSASRWDLPAGFGLGYQIGPDIDLRAQMLFPQINVTPGTRMFGGGVGVQWRFR